jgi:hypothetical protein
MEFHILEPLPKGHQAACAHLIAGCRIVITAPIHMKPHDYFLVDIRSGRVHEIVRGGITIWRAVAVN